MQLDNKIIYALDFDGVICDSAVETAITGWKAAQKIWQDMSEPMPPKALINNFRQLRPFLETGYEATLIMRLLHLGTELESFQQNYQQQIDALIKTENLNIKQLKQLFGDTRDNWIKQAPEEWLQMNPLFKGIKPQLITLADSCWYIITTKQKRFVQQILHYQSIPLSDTRIYAMEAKMSKQETLIKLLNQHPHKEIIFIEDRLPTLQAINNNPQLKKITLQLVNWGYNTATDRKTAQQSAIKIIALEQFIGGV